MYFAAVRHVVEEEFVEEGEIGPGSSFQLGLARREEVKQSLDEAVYSEVGVEVALVLVVPCRLALQRHW